MRKMLNLFKMFQFHSYVDRQYTPQAMGGRGLMSAWDCLQCTAVRLAHYLENADDKHIKKCAQFDKTTLYSILEKGKKFSEAAVFTAPTNIENKPILRQAKIVATRFKEFVHKNRFDTFEKKPQHGVFFRQITTLI